MVATTMSSQHFGPDRIHEWRTAGEEESYEKGIEDGLKEGRRIGLGLTIFFVVAVVLAMYGGLTLFADLTHGLAYCAIGYPSK